MTATETITFVVPGMSCDHCVAAITAEALKVTGVVDVAIDLDTKRVVIRGSSLDEAGLRDAIDEAGFEVGGS